MGREGPLLARDSQLVHGAVDVCRQDFQICRRLNPGPENTWMFLIGEKSQAAEIQLDSLLTTHFLESVSNRRDFCLLDFPQEFQGDMEISGPHPARLFRNSSQRIKERREILPDRGGGFQGKKEADRSGPFYTARSRIFVLYEEMQAHHYQSQLA